MPNPDLLPVLSFAVYGGLLDSCEFIVEAVFVGNDVISCKGPPVAKVFYGYRSNHPIKEPLFASAVICFRVRSLEAARAVGCLEADIFLRVASVWPVPTAGGLMQTFYLDKRLFVQNGPQLSLNSQGIDLAKRALEEASGKMSIPLLTFLSLPERTARSLVEGWELRGWLRPDPSRQNARYITPKLMDILSNSQRDQTVSSLSNG